MATHDYVIDNSTGANVRADINLVLQAILTNNSSSSAPSTTAAYMWWADTTNGVLKIRNSSNNDWVELFQLDGTLTLEDGSASTPALAFRDDLNTGIFSSAADTFDISTGGTGRISVTTTGMSINDNSDDFDIRIEGNADDNLVRLDAGNDRVGIGTSSPSDKLHVEAASNLNAKIECTASGSGANAGLNLKSADGGDFLLQTGNAVSGGFRIYDNGNSAERLRLGAHLLVGLTTAVSSTNGSIQASGPIIAKGVINAHTTDAGVLQYQGNNFLIRAYGASSGTGGIQFNVAGGGGSTDSEKMRLTSAGLLGIGTSSPEANLHIANDANGEGILLKSTGNTSNALTFDANRGTGGVIGVMYGRWNGTTVAQISFTSGSDGTNKDDGIITFGTESAASSGNVNATERMRIDSSGNVGIGVTPTMASGGGLHIRGPAGNQSRLHMTTNRSGDDTGDGFYIIQQGDESSNNETNFINYETASMKFSTSGTERMRVHSTGKVGIGTSSPNKRLEIMEATDSAAVLRVNRSTDVDSNSRDFIEFMRGSNQVGFITATNSSVSYLTSSDYRLKENATAISDGITRLKTLKPYRFNFKAAPDKTIDGFFAHEVTAVPEAISGQKDAVEEDGSIKPQGIDQSKLVPLLVAAVQELITKVETLEAA